MQNMRQVFPRTILLYLFIATRQSKCISSEISSYPEQTNAEVGLPHTPSLQSVMAQPQGVSVLLDAAATTLKKLYPSNWTLSAVRHVTREGEGLPHVVEVRASAVASCTPPYTLEGPPTWLAQPPCQVTLVYKLSSWFRMPAGA